MQSLATTNTRQAVKLDLLNPVQWDALVSEFIRQLYLNRSIASDNTAKSYRGFLQSDQGRGDRPHEKYNGKQPAPTLHQFFTDNGIDAPGREHIEHYITMLEARHYSLATINHRITSLKRFFQFLDESGIYQNDCHQVRRLKAKKTKAVEPYKRAYFKQPHIDALFNLCDKHTLKGKRDRAILATFIYSGLRRFELANLRHQDLKQDTVTDENGAEVIVYNLDILGKGRTSRELQPIASKAIPFIRDYQEALTEEIKTAGADPLFVSLCRRSADKFGPLSLSAITGIIKRLINQAVKANIIPPDRAGRLCVHSLRHTFGAKLHKAGCDAFTIKALMRHKDIKTTFRYVETVAEENKALNLNKYL